MERWRIKKGDQVVVVTGKYKKRQGKVLKVLRKDRRLIVEGVNMITRHVKPSPQYPDGGRLRQEASIHASNVALIDSESQKPTRVGIKILENGQKVRYAKKSGEIIDTAV